MSCNSANVDGSKSQAARLAPIGVTYAAFAVLALAVYYFIAEGAFSSVMTMSAIAQCLGIALLCVQEISAGSAAGISAGSLVLDAFALVCRLANTTWLNGYLPVDASGDHVYQAIDMLTLMMILWLLQRLLVVHRGTYQRDEDSLHVGPVIGACLLLGVLLHADANRKAFFDSLWMAGLFLEVVSVLPQLSLTIMNGGRIEALTSHYVACLALSRVLSGAFMWAARKQIRCKPWIGSFSHAIWAILGAHVLHLLLLGDFMYFYLRAVVRQGWSKAVELGSADGYIV